MPERDEVERIRVFQQFPQEYNPKCHECGVSATRSGICWLCGNCEYHCAHMACSYCGQHVLGLCPSCKRCGPCCWCVDCPSCQGPGLGPLCAACHECRRCCGGECQAEKPIRPLLGRGPAERGVQFHAAGITERKRNPSSRFVAVEIEIADSRRDDETSSITGAVSAWGGRIVGDGSLPVTGFEINTAPASGDRFVDQMLEIGRALKERNAVVTKACGLHVHVDARDYSYYDIRRLALTYAAIEQTLFQMVPDYRRTNKYCQPCGERLRRSMRLERLPLKAVKKSIFDGVYSRSAKMAYEVRGTKSADNRYSALNLHSWFYRGTIECRLFPGTTKPSKIILWGQLWAAILDRVLSWTDEEMAEAIRGKTPQAVLETVLGDNRVLKQFVRHRIAEARRINQGARVEK